MGPERPAVHLRRLPQAGGTAAPRSLETEVETMQNSTMNRPLRILHLEDNPHYSTLVRDKLAAEGFNPEVVCVESREGFTAALDKDRFDLIIADYFLPAYDGIRALKLAREKSPETPIPAGVRDHWRGGRHREPQGGGHRLRVKALAGTARSAVHRALHRAEERRNRLLAETTLS